MTGPSAHGSGCLCMSVGVTYKREVWSVLAQQSGEDSLSLDTLFVLKHISIHEAVQHGRVGMDINVELQTNPLQVRSRTQKEKRGFFKGAGSLGTSSIRERSLQQMVSLGAKMDLYDFVETLQGKDCDPHGGLTKCYRQSRK